MATTKIVLPGSRRRQWATRLYRLRPDTVPVEPSEDAIKVVCISDTHGRTPHLPAGDLLLHTGDMTGWGSFEEIQDQLSWISSQSHKYKVVIAGNHDVLLDDEYMSQEANTNRLPWTSQEHGAHQDLNFGSCIYLRNESITLNFDNGRKLNIYGSPITPKSAGNSAFQVSTDVWTNTIPVGTDIVLSHGPPYRHLDGFPHAGSIHLLQEILRIRPRLFVCGHIHAAYGREDTIFDRLGRDYEGVMVGWNGYDAMLSMILCLMWTGVSQFLHRLTGNAGKGNRSTTLVNAAVVSGPKNELTNEPIVVKI